MTDQTVPCPNGKCDEMHDPAKCMAHVKVRDDNGTHVGNRPCKNSPKQGVDVCWKHGAKAKQVAVAADRNVKEAKVEARIQQWLDAKDLDPTNPVDGLLEACDTLGAVVGLLRAMLGTQDPVSGMFGTNRHGEQVPSVLSEQLRRWTKDYAQACKLAVDAGLDERRIRLQEVQVHAVGAALNEAIDVLPVEHRDMFRVRFAAALRALPAGDPT